MAASEIGELPLIAEDGRILQALLDLREAALDLADEALHRVHARRLPGAYAGMCRSNQPTRRAWRSARRSGRPSRW